MHRGVFLFVPCSDKNTASEYRFFIHRRTIINNRSMIISDENRLQDEMFITESGDGFRTIGTILQSLSTCSDHRYRNITTPYSTGDFFYQKWRPKDAYARSRLIDRSAGPPPRLLLFSIRTRGVIRIRTLYFKLSVARFPRDVEWSQSVDVLNFCKSVSDDVFGKLLPVKWLLYAIDCIHNGIKHFYFNNYIKKQIRTPVNFYSSLVCTIIGVPRMLTIRKITLQFSVMGVS